MRRIISLAICLLMVFALSLPAFAAEAPTEYVPNGYIGLEPTGGNFIISRDCEVDYFFIPNSRGQVTIAKGVTVTVKRDFVNYGTINVGGTLILSDTYNKANLGTINVFTCGRGYIVGNVDGRDPVSKDEHHFVNGFCLVCGEKACEHKNLKTVCADCGEVISTYSATPTENTASTLSEGYPEIVYGIGGLAVGFVIAALIFRKKKVAVSSTAADDEE